MVESFHDNNNFTIVLQPNRSATWAETKIFVAVICATTLAIGVFWTFIGAWMVLPFSGLEAALVAYVFYRVCQSTYQRQVITGGADHITVQFGTHFPKRTWQLERPRTRVVVTPATHQLAGPTLVIADALHSIELGNFLNPEDKQITLAALRQTCLPMRAPGESGVKVV